MRRPTDSNCTWNIVVSKTRGVRFLVSALTVEHPNKCEDNYLKVYNTPFSGGWGGLVGGVDIRINKIKIEIEALTE
jgi:hypothetical protein